jgi:hypothetical protein
MHTRSRTHPQDFHGPLASNWSKALSRGKYGIISRENEIAAARTLSIRLRQELSAYPTSIEEDATLLKQIASTDSDSDSTRSMGSDSNGDVSPSLEVAVTLRLSKKVLLRDMAEYLEKLPEASTLPYV